MVGAAVCKSVGGNVIGDLVGELVGELVGLAVLTDGAFVLLVGCVVMVYCVGLVVCRFFLEEGFGDGFAVKVFLPVGDCVPFIFVTVFVGDSVVSLVLGRFVE